MKNNEAYTQYIVSTVFILYDKIERNRWLFSQRKGKLKNQIIKDNIFYKHIVSKWWPHTYPFPQFIYIGLSPQN